MALPVILQAIAADADAKAAAIVAEAETAAESRLEAARVEAENRRQVILAKAMKAAENERSRLQYRARLDVSRLLVAAQEHAFQDIHRTVSEQLAVMRGQPGYPALFAALLGEAIGATSGAVSLGVHEDDVELAAALLPAERSVRLEPGLATWGGVTVSSEDGRVITLNTLESRLERALPDLRPLLSSLLTEAMTTAVGVDDGRA